MKLKTLNQILGVLVTANRTDLAETLAKAPDKKWMQKLGKTMDKKGTEGSLRKHFGLKEGQPVTIQMLDRELSKLKSKKGDKPYSDNDLQLVRKLNAAKNMMDSKKK